MAGDITGIPLLLSNSNGAGSVCCSRNVVKIATNSSVIEISGVLNFLIMSRVYHAVIYRPISIWLLICGIYEENFFIFLLWCRNTSDFFKNEW